MRLFTGTSASQLDESNYVIVHSWPQSRRNVAGHISMELVCDGKEYYISYWHQRDYKKTERDRIATQYYGVEPYWTESFGQDCLIEGYRHVSPENPKANARIILTNITTEDFTRKLYPAQSIRLNVLDVRAMRDDFLAYKASDHKWAFFSGSQFHAEGAHNCSSIVLHLLTVGGIEKTASSYGQWLRNAGLAASLLTSPFWAAGVVQAGAYVLLVGAAGAVLGGGIDGVLDVQNFLRVIEIQKGRSFSTRVGLTAVSFFVSSAASLLTAQHIVGKRLTLPDNVMTVVQSAYEFERRNYTQDVGSKATPKFV